MIRPVGPPGSPGPVHIVYRRCDLRTKDPKVKNSRNRRVLLRTCSSDPYKKGSLRASSVWAWWLSFWISCPTTVNKPGGGDDAGAARTGSRWHGSSLSSLKSTPSLRSLFVSRLCLFLGHVLNASSLWISTLLSRECRLTVPPLTHRTCPFFPTYRFFCLVHFFC